MTIGELDLEAETVGRTPDSTDDGTPTATDFGMELDPVTPEMARQVELPRGQGGAIVSNVDRDGAAALGGVRPNDIILKVNSQAVTSIAQITRALQGTAPGAPVFLLVWRDGQQQFLTLTKR